MEGDERWMWRRKRRGVVWISWYPPSMPALSSSKNSSSLATVTLQFFSSYHSFIQLQFTCLSFSLSRSSVSGHGHHWSIRCWHVCEDAGIPDAINQGQTATRGWSNPQGQSISLSLSLLGFPIIFISVYNYLISSSLSSLLATIVPLSITVSHRGSQSLNCGSVLTSNFP